MKFEGTQVNIPIKGIMRAGTDNLCADGAMNEVVGMEYKDGSWLPYKEKEETASAVYSDSGSFIRGLNIKNVFIHKLTEDSQKHLFISYADQFEAADNDLWYEHSHTGTVYNVRKLASGVKDLSIVGNMLCVSTENGMMYFIYEGGAYHEKQTGYYPKVDLRVTAGLYEKERTDGVKADLIGVRYITHILGQQFDWATQQDAGTIPQKTRKESIEGGLAAARGEVRDRGGLTGYFFACVGYRGKNGEILAASAPILLSRPYDVLGDDVVKTNGQGFNRKVYNESTQVWENVPIAPSKAKDRAIYQSTLASEVDWDRTEKKLPATGFSKLYARKNSDIGNYTFTVFDDDSGTTVKFIDRMDYSNPSNVSPIYGEVTVGENPLLLYRLADNIEPWRNEPLSPTLFCTETETLLRGGDEITGDYKRDYTFMSYAVGNTLQYRVPELTVNKRGELQSICIFISPEVYPFKSVERTEDILSVLRTSSKENIYHYSNGAAVPYRNYWSYVTSYYTQRREASSIIDDLKDIHSLYLVKEMNIEDITPGDEWVSVDLKGLLGDTLLTRESLPLTAFYRDTYKPAHLDAYNYRLHMYNYVQRLFSGYTYNDMAFYSGEGQYEDTFIPVLYPDLDAVEWEIDVELQDNGGNRTAVRFGEGTGLPKLSPMLTYPSGKAVAMIVRIRGHVMNTTPTQYARFEKRFELSHDFDTGLSHYIDENLVPITIPLVETEWDTLPVYSDTNMDATYTNGLKVSNTADPSFFPAAFTYRIGNREIIKLARLTTPVSQDNFGSNQLIVFCTDGIFSMTVDTSGNGAYTSIPPLVSPEVCVNRNSICEIGGAILFASDKGLMILTGANGVEQFTPQLNGQPRFLPARFSSKKADGIYRKMINSRQILSEDYDSFEDSISTTDFADFIREQDTHLIYISIKNKLLAYNKNYDYVYFIDIATRNTTKLTMSACCDDKSLIGRNMWELVYANPSLPEYTYRLHEFGYMSEDDDKIPCLIVTRPIKVQQDDKCSYRVVLTGYFEGIEDHWADLVVLGSLDADHWRVIGVKEKKLVGGFHNLGCLTERGSWKYLMFIFAGKLSNNSHIDSVDITVDGRYNNKKR